MPYFIASHPGSDLNAMIDLAVFLKRNGYQPDQVQDFIPAPFDIATCMYHTGLDPFTGEEVYVAKHLRDRKLQRALLQFFKPENYFEVRQALSAAGRSDLIGSGCDALIPASRRRRQSRRGWPRPGASSPRGDTFIRSPTPRPKVRAPAPQGRQASRRRVVPPATDRTVNSRASASGRSNQLGSKPAMNRQPRAIRAGNPGTKCPDPGHAARPSTQTPGPSRLQGRVRRRPTDRPRYLERRRRRHAAAEMAAAIAPAVLHSIFTERIRLAPADLDRARGPRVDDGAGIVTGLRGAGCPLAMVGRIEPLQMTRVEEQLLLASLLDSVRSRLDRQNVGRGSAATPIVGSRRRRPQLDGPRRRT